MLIMRVVFALVLFIIVVRLALHKDAFESFVFAVALAVGLTPEFLPMITSVTLASGAVRMAREQVVVKHLPAIQNFGSIDVFCSDKTGTLTKGEMILSRSMDPLGRSSDRVLGLAYLNSKFETGIRSPLDSAILATERHDLAEYRKIDEIPFDFNRRRLSIVVEREGSNGIERLLIAKGAPEGILDVCESYEDAGQIRAIDSATLESVNHVYQGLCSGGFRALAVAYRTVELHDGFTPKDEHSLVLAGFLAFADPPIEDAAASVAAMRRDGVHVKILTGDNERVAQYICAQVGLDAGTVVLGNELDQMSDTALAHVAEETTIFARVSPMQKLRIILALKHRGHVVGYMGDGINDAPSLHAADVGISVATAVDVARDAADIIMLKSGLGTLHRGIIEGRKASANVLKYLLMGTSSNFGNMFSMAGASLFSAVSPHATDADSAEQFPVRHSADHHSFGQCGRYLYSFPATLGYAPDPQLHDIHRADQLDLRFPDFLCIAAFFSCQRTPLPHGLVCGVAGHADFGSVRRSEPWAILFVAAQAYRWRSRRSRSWRLGRCFRIRPSRGCLDLCHSPGLTGRS